MASRTFATFDASIFDHLEFITVDGIQETWPMRLIISYPEENHQQVTETYSKYETTDPPMVAWLGKSNAGSDCVSSGGKK